jgi:predicted GIY-YIG superfamily endonuclease
MEQSDLLDRKGLLWDQEEDDRLRNGFNSGASIAELARIHRRRQSAIDSRLVKIGLRVRKTRPEHVFTGTRICAWTYLILSERGEVYLGATTNIRNRLRSHNSKSGQYTSGRHWHLLAAKGFLSRKEAFQYESYLKGHGTKRREWKRAYVERAKKLISRYQYNFSVDHWAFPEQRRQKKVSARGEDWADLSPRAQKMGPSEYGVGSVVVTGIDYPYDFVTKEIQMKENSADYRFITKDSARYGSGTWCLECYPQTRQLSFISGTGCMYIQLKQGVTEQQADQLRALMNEYVEEFNIVDPGHKG